ncbi:hypothetical protein H4219_004812 [Mycoemilia scoparia]|uniref:Uncharacterized protein n=1 Tax=Mycoemilia scoparia TaxID=417184 RepID=A0A9W8DM88_9FUNG|nr:hypothetical protein H4219_004812 [Mycoemilia scoparia]
MSAGVSAHYSIFTPLPVPSAGAGVYSQPFPMVPGVYYESPVGPFPPSSFEISFSTEVATKWISPAIPTQLMSDNAQLIASAAKEGVFEGVTSGIYAVFSPEVASTAASLNTDKPHPPGHSLSSNIGESRSHNDKNHTSSGIVSNSRNSSSSSRSSSYSISDSDEGGAEASLKHQSMLVLGLSAIMALVFI